MENSQVKVNNTGGIGVCGLLGVVFVTLKLTGIINWSWFYVTMPFWGPLAAVATLVLVIAIAAGIVKLCS